MKLTLEFRHAREAKHAWHPRVHARHPPCPTPARTPCSGGLDILFSNAKACAVDFPAPDGRATVGQLLPWARDTLLTERPELFMKGDSV